MSATGRGTERRADDFYATPPWCVEALLKRCDLPGGLWLEPTAGNGAIAAEVLRHRRDVRWHLNELREEEAEGLRRLQAEHDNNSDAESVTTGDFLTMPMRHIGYSVVLSNPPFSLALPVIQYAMVMAPIVVMLLRINFLASQKRAEWMREHTPSIYVLPRRPSFTGAGTDATEYAWFVWDSQPAKVVIL